VTTPGGVELDKDILGGVLNNLIEVLSNNDLDISIVLLGDGLGLSVCNEFTILEVL